MSENQDDSWQSMPGDMPPEELRRYGRAVVDWIADYLSHPEHVAVLSRSHPGSIKEALPETVPEHGEPMEAILRDFDDLIMPGVTHWNHPAFFAYFAITASGPGILGEMLSAALNVNAMLWRTSPAATELEEVTLGWLREMLGLPDDFEGVVYDTASISTLVALAAAREAAGMNVREEGLFGLPRLTVYTSEQAHSSVEKAAITIGIGQRQVRKVPTNDVYQMDVPALERMLENDIASGAAPFCVVATVGTTSTTSVDPVPLIADICSRYGLWLHVDAAYGGSAAVLPERRWVLAGVERADSFLVNPHKWLFTPIDFSAFYSRRLHEVRTAFSLIPEYLRTDDQGVRNYMDYGPQLGRRFRALKLWFVLRSLGRNGIALRIRDHIRLAELFASWIESAPGWEVLAPVPFSTVCFRYHPPGLDRAALDDLNATILERVNATGEVFLSHTVLREGFALRLAIGNLRTTEEHVARAWHILGHAAAEVPR